MAALSDQLLVVTILAYLAALVGHAAEYALTMHDPRARTEASAVPKLLAVGAAPARPARRPPLAGAAAPTAAHWAGRTAVALFVLGVTAHVGTVVSRGIAAQRLTWGNMYEFIIATTMVAAIAWLTVLRRRPDIRQLGLFVVLVLMLLLGAAGMIAYTPVGPLVPALDSYWFVIHVAAAVTSSGIFLVGSVPAALYLIRAGHDRGEARFPYTLGQRLPAADSLERLTFRLHAFAFPIWTFAALIAGPIWAEASWGRYWGWDPKEVWAFISWIVYAGYLHARATPSIRRTTVMWFALLGWLTMLVNLFGVNLFFGGLHSYAGVN